MTRSAWLVSLLTFLLMVRPAAGQTLSGEALVEALRQGGYVLVMRHTSSPREAPTTASANADDVSRRNALPIAVAVVRPVSSN